jgi:hypothetical protein
MKLGNLHKKKLALCIDAGEYEGVSLFGMKIYEYLPDAVSEKQGFLHVIDEEGEPYYYDARAFLKISTRPNGMSISFKRANGTRPKRTAIRARRH